MWSLKRNYTHAQKLFWTYFFLIFKYSRIHSVLFGKRATVFPNFVASFWIHLRWLMVFFLISAGMTHAYIFLQDHILQCVNIFSITFSSTFTTKLSLLPVSFSRPLTLWASYFQMNYYYFFMYLHSNFVYVHSFLVAACMDPCACILPLCWIFLLFQLYYIQFWFSCIMFHLIAKYLHKYIPIGIANSLIQIFI